MIVLPLHELLLATVVRWLGLLALAVLIGGLVLDLFILPREGEELAAARRSFRRWRAAAVAALIVATVGELLTRARTMSGGDLAQVGAALPLVLTRTHFGAIWITRIVTLGLLVVLSRRRSRFLRTAALLLSLGVALTGSLMGHAADWGDLSLTVLVDWIHAVAAAAWTGGLFGLALTIKVDRAAWPPVLLGLVAQRFSRLAGRCLLVVVATGIYNGWIQVPSLSALATTTYGRALVLKVVLALGLACLGGVNRYAVLPDLASDPARGRPGRWRRLGRIAMFGAARTPRAAAASRLSRFVRRETMIAVAVFGCTAVLGESTPKSHAGHRSRETDADSASLHVTMEELHASGGVPKGWIFAPPTGDPSRGREVFKRLECFACHAVAGERFPRPSRPGPALTAVGEHHPAGYLLESIMNPDAIVVDGPGYTGPDGRSIMPDYRDSLSARELIDLVAYLKTLGR